MGLTWNNSRDILGVSEHPWAYAMNVSLQKNGLKDLFNSVLDFSGPANLVLPSPISVEDTTGHL